MFCPEHKVLEILLSLKAAVLLRFDISDSYNELMIEKPLADFTKVFRLEARLASSHCRSLSLAQVSSPLLSLRILPS